MSQNNEIQNKQIARERDENKCVVCGTTENIQVHHIFPKSQMQWLRGSKDVNSIDNLITLCPEHHASMHPELQLVTNRRKGFVYFYKAFIKMVKRFQLLLTGITNFNNYEKYSFILKLLTGSDKFRGIQYEVIDSVISKKDTLVVMPTGSGKSACFQIPAILLPNQTLVLSPLKSLMYDQVKGLLKLLIPSTYINSSLSKKTIENRLDHIIKGHFKLIYLAPERFFNKYTDYEFKDNRVLQAEYDLLVVDEAHCVEKWGRNFRLAYKKIGNLREHMGNPSVVALTASASKTAQKEIIESLKMKDPNVFVTGFYRPELKLNIIKITPENQKINIIKKIIADNRGEKILIYVLTIKQGEELKEELNLLGYEVEFYHSKLPEDDKIAIHNRFSGDYGTLKPLKIIIATSAFGMGIDLKDLHVIIHYHMTTNIEDYYQQIGRAGRDGKNSQIYLLYQKDDEKLNKYMINKSLENNKYLDRETKDSVIEKELGELQTMLDYLNTKDPWGYIVDYFGDQKIKTRKGILPLLKIIEFLIYGALLWLLVVILNSTK